jgi:MFS family permease
MGAFRERFSPLIEGSFKFFYSVQFLSYIGTWMQDMAKSWILLGLKGSSTSIGALMFATALPNILLLPVAGGWVDRWGPRKILLYTQSALSLLALTLGLLVFTEQIDYKILLLIAFLEGCAIAFDVPAFNLVTPRLVQKKDFQQALALNSVAFHLSRVLGPAAAGLVVATWGESHVFFINGVSFLLIVGVLLKLNLDPNPQASSQKKDSGSLKEVFVFLRHHPLFFRIMSQFMLVMALLFPLVFTTLRVLAKNRFQADSHEFGYFVAAPGIGALMGSLCFFILKPKNPYSVLPYGLTGIVLFLFCIAETHSKNLMLANFMLFSFCMFLTLSALLVTVQLKVEDHIRGRVSSLIGFSFVAISPMMSVPIGFLSDFMGERAILWTMGTLFGLLTLGLYSYSRKNIQALNPKGES